MCKEDNSYKSNSNLILYIYFHFILQTLDKSVITTIAITALFFFFVYIMKIYIKNMEKKYEIVLTNNFSNYINAKFLKFLIFTINHYIK